MRMIKFVTERYLECLAYSTSLGIGISISLFGTSSKRNKRFAERKRIGLNIATPFAAI